MVKRHLLSDTVSCGREKFGIWDQKVYFSALKCPMTQRRLLPSFTLYFHLKMARKTTVADFKRAGIVT